MYKPENGPALNLFAGVHLRDYLSLQGNYIWNGNSLMLTSSFSSDMSSYFYEQQRNSAQHGIVGDVLLYFRNRPSHVRPYLSMGAGFVHLRSSVTGLVISRDTPVLPRAKFTSTRPALRVAVGIDISFARRWGFRYSFSETIRRNAISAQLTPPGTRNLANFQNLFGVVKHF